MTSSRRRQGSKCDELFAGLVTVYMEKPRVTLEQAFHNEVLKVDNKVFAMVVRGQLVVKVPAQQCADMIVARRAVAFEPSPGRRMREWIAVDPVDPGSANDWGQLAEDAYRYVGSRPAGKSPRNKVR